jgi:hypothetical protein
MTESDSNREREIAERAGRLFRESVAGLDGQTRSRLARARLAAVEAAGERRGHSWFLPSRLVPAGGVAAVLIALALVWQGPQRPVAPAVSVVVNDLDLLLEGENLDLFEELDFYAWLLLQPELLETNENGDGSG